MRIFLFLLLVMVFIPSDCFGDFYRWRDKDGVIHIVDDLHKVPEEYRDKVEVFKTFPRKKAPPSPRVVIPPPPSPAKKKKTYGGYTFEWWVETIGEKRQELEDLETRYEEMKSFITVFESGRRFGQIYPQKDIDRYKEYKDTLPALEKEIEALRDELDRLIRKARAAGVPREVWK